MNRSITHPLRWETAAVAQSRRARNERRWQLASLVLLAACLGFAAGAALTAQWLLSHLP